MNTTFINGDIQEEILMAQPKGFVNEQFPTHVCKLKKGHQWA